MEIYGNQPAFKACILWELCVLPMYKKAVIGYIQTSSFKFAQSKMTFEESGFIYGGKYVLVHLNELVR